MDSRFAGDGGVRGCTSRYGGGGGGGGGGCGCGFYDISTVDRMMLKFRPITPKPVAFGSGSRDSNAENVGKSSRRKRSRKRKAHPPPSPSPEKVSGGRDPAATLSLMPETPDVNDHSPVKKIPSRDEHVTLPSSERGQTASFVTVERVTEAVVDGGGWVGWAEMEGDTCPRFVSDGGDRVVWVNKAYKEMVGDGEEVAVAAVVVRAEGGLPAAFTCDVRVTCGNDVRFSTVMVPCDAWRVGGGGYAWRLDVKAALCLGR